MHPDHIQSCDLWCFLFHTTLIHTTLTFAQSLFLQNGLLFFYFCIIKNFSFDLTLYLLCWSPSVEFYFRWSFTVIKLKNRPWITSWRVSKYGVISGLYLGTFHPVDIAVIFFAQFSKINCGFKFSHWFVVCQLHQFQDKSVQSSDSSIYLSTLHTKVEIIVRSNCLDERWRRITA